METTEHYVQEEESTIKKVKCLENSCVDLMFVTEKGNSDESAHVYTHDIGFFFLFFSVSQEGGDR